MIKKIEEVRRWASGPVHIGESAQPRLEPICDALLLLYSEVKNLKKELFRSMAIRLPGMTEEKLKKIMELLEE